MTQPRAVLRRAVMPADASSRRDAGIGLIEIIAAVKAVRQGERHRGVIGPFAGLKSKRPTADPLREIELQVGSYDLRQPGQKAATQISGCMATAGQTYKFGRQQPHIIGNARGIPFGAKLDLEQRPIGRLQRRLDHLAAFPLAHVGREHADGHLLGVALAVPAAAQAKSFPSKAGNFVSDNVHVKDTVVGQIVQFMLSNYEAAA